MSLVFIPKILAQRRYTRLTQKELRILAMLTKQQNSEDMVDESSGLQASSTVATPFSGNMKNEERRPDANENVFESEKSEKSRKSLEDSTMTHIHSNTLSKKENCSTKKKISKGSIGNETSANELFRRAISLAQSSDSTGKIILTDFFQKVDKSKLTETEQNELETLLRLIEKR